MIGSLRAVTARTEPVIGGAASGVDHRVTAMVAAEIGALEAALGHLTCLRSAVAAGRSNVSRGW